MRTGCFVPQLLDYFNLLQRQPTNNRVILVSYRGFRKGAFFIFGSACTTFVLRPIKTSRTQTKCSGDLLHAVADEVHVVHGGFDVFVAEDHLHGFNIHTRGNELRGGRVAQIVEANHLTAPAF